MTRRSSSDARRARPPACARMRAAVGCTRGCAAPRRRKTIMHTTCRAEGSRRGDTVRPASRRCMWRVRASSGVGAVRARLHLVDRRRRVHVDCRRARVRGWYRSSSSSSRGRGRRRRLPLRHDLTKLGLRDALYRNDVRTAVPAHANSQLCTRAVPCQLARARDPTSPRSPTLHLARQRRALGPLCPRNAREKRINTFRHSSPLTVHSRARLSVRAAELAPILNSDSSTHMRVSPTIRIAPRGCERSTTHADGNLRASETVIDGGNFAASHAATLGASVASAPDDVVASARLTWATPAPRRREVGGGPTDTRRQSRRSCRCRGGHR